MAESQPVAEALRAEILKLTTEGDSKVSGALTAEVLAKVVRVAKTGRDLLMSLNTNPANLGSMLKRPQSPFSFAGQAVPDDGLGDDSSVPTYSAYAPAPAVENFGMTAIRELLAAAKELKNGRPSSVELVEALALARDEGLTDVAKELETQLGIGKQPPVPAKLETLISAGDGLTKTTVQETHP